MILLGNSSQTKISSDGGELGIQRLVCRCLTTGLGAPPAVRCGGAKSTEDGSEEIHGCVFWYVRYYVRSRQSLFHDKIMVACATGWGAACCFGYLAYLHRSTSRCPSTQQIRTCQPSQAVPFWGEAFVQLVQHSLLCAGVWLAWGWKDIGVGDFSPTDSCRQRNRFLPTIKASDSSQLGLLALYFFTSKEW